MGRCSSLSRLGWGPADGAGEHWPPPRRAPGPLPKPCTHVCVTCTWQPVVMCSRRAVGRLGWMPQVPAPRASCGSPCRQNMMTIPTTMHRSQLISTIGSDQDSGQPSCAGTDQKAGSHTSGAATLSCCARDCWSAILCQASGCSSCCIRSPCVPVRGSCSPSPQRHAQLPTQINGRQPADRPVALRYEQECSEENIPVTSGVTE